jgi:hypothetical protein
MSDAQKLLSASDLIDVVEVRLATLRVDGRTPTTRPIRAVAEASIAKTLRRCPLVGARGDHPPHPPGAFHLSQIAAEQTVFRASTEVTTEKWSPALPNDDQLGMVPSTSWRSHRWSCKAMISFMTAPPRLASTSWCSHRREPGPEFQRHWC